MNSAFIKPILVALAAGGLIIYGLIGWIGWWAAQRFKTRMGPIVLFVLYAVAMGIFSLVATIMYLLISVNFTAGDRFDE